MAGPMSSEPMVAKDGGTRNTGTDGRADSKVHSYKQRRLGSHKAANKEQSLDENSKGIGASPWADDGQTEETRRTLVQSCP